MLDDALRKALEERFRPKDGNTDMNDKLFRIGGPLGNVGPKVDLAYQLYMLDKNARNTMHGISEVRNFFAHNLRMSFHSASDKLSKSLDKLSLHKDKIKYPHPFTRKDSEFDIEPITSRKELFITNLKLCLILLMMDRDTHVPNSCVPKTLPDTLVQPNTPHQPSPSHKHIESRPPPQS